RLTGDTSYPDLRFAVWSAENGQDDLTWTTAKSADQKTYVADFEATKLKSLGTVHIHAYTGTATFVMKTTVELEGASVGKVSVENLDVAAGTCTLVLSELVHPELLKEVVVPVWSDAKQADLVWYQAEKVPGKNLSDLTYQVKMNIFRHSFNTGTYQVHVYSRDISGKQLYQTRTQVTYPVSGEVAVLPTSDAAVYQAVVNSPVVPGGWGEMHFAVWSDEGGQDDLRWINTKTTSANININDFKHLGLYHVHLYAVGKNGALKFVGKATFTPSVAEPVVELGAQGSDGSVEILVKNVMMQSNLKDIRAAVWSANKGQDDLRWYSAVKQSDGTYKIVANLKNHKDSGQYFIHVYAETRDGKLQFLGKTEELVVAAPKTAEITVSDVKEEGGAFTVKIVLPDDSPIVSKIQVPIWCVADQSDIKWYDAVKQADGSYEVVVRSSNHKEHAGTYQIHVYATYASGVFAFVGKTTQEMKVPPITVMNGTKGKRSLEIRNCEDAKSVSVAVWTSQGSQDDLIWYPASKNSDGAWQVVVDASKHKHGGEYIAHVYADNKFAGSMIFDMPYSELKTTWTDMAGSMKVAAENNQLILVSASGTSAQITMLNKNTDGTWFQLLTTSGYVGINGVGPTTEWNGRTPPGVFGFTKAFGILPNPGTAFQYTQVDSSHYWVDDVNSKYYNKFVSTRSVARDWSSAEHLIDYTGSYGYCLAIDYNPECTPGVGSAIFLHCSAGRPTA
ncbi:MAG: GBS Bsp-like repeat-containing protein, partial [Lachnospiraceae bacterium]|nr:GBS Bsp-like repeat-containing protein [Lachnospiraceae bacterium]